MAERRSLPGWVRNILAWLHRYERPILSGTALAGIIVAILTGATALYQAALLANERDTPYQTARYVRQLEVTERIVGAVEEQWLTLVNFRNVCGLRGPEDPAAEADFREFRAEFERGSQELHLAYAAGLVSLPERVHPDLNAIWEHNEDFYDTVFLPAKSCHSFLNAYRDNHGDDTFAQMRRREGDLRCAMREEMGVDVLPAPDALRRAHVARNEEIAALAAAEKLEMPEAAPTRGALTTCERRLRGWPSAPPAAAPATAATP